MSIALIDGDIFTRRFTSAAEHEMFQLSNGEEVRTRTKANKACEEDPTVSILDSYRVTSPIHFVQHSIRLAISDIMETTGAADFAIYLGERGGKNFRHELYPEYKAHRKQKKKPEHYEAIYNWLIEEYQATICYNVEADDMLGILTSVYSDWFICSNDKDMLQIPGKHYNFIKKEKIAVSQINGDKMLFTQVLMGDPTDNIPGLQGVGEVTAKKMMRPTEDVKEMYEVAASAYKEQHGDDWFNQLMLNGSLVYLLRKHGDSFAQYLARNGAIPESHVA